VVTKFRNSCGSTVRDIVPITLQKWKDLDEDTRNKLWAKLSESFKVPKGTGCSKEVDALCDGQDVSWVEDRDE
jgi:hypothetical protein